MNTKQQLYNYSQEFVKEKLQTIQKTIQSNKEALNSETKSSAGDKHETGRAMLQLEMEKAGQQLAIVNQMQEQMAKINVETASKKACLGSLIITNKFKYFLSISVGMVTLDSEDYFVVSPSSPIGKLLLGKEVGDTIDSRGLKLEITEIL